MSIHQLVVEIFKLGPKWQTNQHGHPWSHAASMAKHENSEEEVHTNVLTCESLFLCAVDARGHELYDTFITEKKHKNLLRERGPSVLRLMVPSAMNTLVCSLINLLGFISFY